MSEPISVALLRVGSRFLDNKQSRLLLNWPDFRLQCGEGPGQNRCYKNQIIWCFIQLFKHTFVFVWETENVCPIISEADHEYRVIKAILLCRFCTYPLLPEHLIPSSVVLTVTPFFSCVMDPHHLIRTHISSSPILIILWGSDNVHIPSLICSRQWEPIPPRHMRFCAPVWIPEHVYHNVLKTCWYSMRGDFHHMGLIFIVVVLIITIIYWHYSWVIIAELIPGDVLGFFFFFYDWWQPPPPLQLIKDVYWLSTASTKG